MKTKLCPLCTEVRPVIKSHLAASGIYDRLRTLGREDSRSITMTPDEIGPTRWEIMQHLLCPACDQRLADYGENWVMLNGFDGKDFRLLQRLKLSLTISPYSLPDADAFATRVVGMDDIENAAHFALGLLWRTAVTSWRLPKTETLSLELGEANVEILRQYLKGDSAFPSNYHVKVTVCTDRMSHGLFVAPYKTPDGPWHYRTMALGFIFDIFIGENIHPNLRHQACMTEPNRVIFMQDCSRIAFHVMHTVRQAYETSRTRYQ